MWPLRIAVCGAVVFNLLRSEEVRAKRVDQLDVGLLRERLANDGPAALHDISAPSQPS